MRPIIIFRNEYRPRLLGQGELISGFMLHVLILLNTSMIKINKAEL